MKHLHPPASVTPALSSAQDWVQILAKYREPSTERSVFELSVTLVPFLALWALSLWVMSFSYILSFGIAIVNAGFLVRLFAIQHDCGHSAFLKNRQVSDWIGRAIGVFTLTPYDVWRRTHSAHHSASGNLDKRGMGDVHTLTVNEYRAMSGWGRLGYRLYRHPLVLFGLGPSYLFLLQNRLPLGLMASGSKYWISAMGTNLAIAAILIVLIYLGGIAAFFVIFLPTTLIAASAGVWLFYIQHQFEETHWDTEENWHLHDAALHGSSHYDLPPVLQWLTANIGIHHVHHLYSRIPFYRLTEVLRDHPVLATSQRLTIRDSLDCVKLQLWDESKRRLLTYAQMREAYGVV